MKRIESYKFSCSLGIVIILSFCLLFWTEVPTKGVQAQIQQPTAVQIGYLTSKTNQTFWTHTPEFAQKMNMLIGPAKFLQVTNSQSIQSGLYPIFDESLSNESFSQQVPLVSGAIPELGKTAYSVDYGNVRCYFLNASALLKGDQKQLIWIQENMNQNRQMYNLLLMNQDPKLPVIWKKWREIGIDVVLIGDEVYFPQNLTIQPPSEIKSFQSDWNVWNTTSQFQRSSLLVIEGNSQQLTIKAVNAKGESLDLLEQQFISPHMNQKEINLIGYADKWSYLPGSMDIKAVIPLSVDITGEQPITERYQVPAEDWRSSLYEDREWKVFNAPFGSTFIHRSGKQFIRTVLLPNKLAPSHYFRKTFFLEANPAQMENLWLNIHFEDGFVAYLNGEEIARDGLPTGLITSQTLAGPNEPVFHKKVSLKNHLNKLIKGRNTIAVEVHLSHPGAENSLFDARLAYTVKE